MTDDTRAVPPIWRQSWVGWLTVPAGPERAFCRIGRAVFARGPVFGWVTSVACGLWLLAFAASGLEGPGPFPALARRFRCEKS